MSCIYKYKGQNYTKDEFYSLVKNTMVQPRTVQKYEKVLFPKGETAAKIEGHETIADEIRKIDRELSDLKKIINEDGVVYTEDGEIIRRVNSRYSIEDAGGKIDIEQKNIENSILTLEKKKQELKSQGVEKLKPIEAFYEIKVGNILEKQFGKENVKTITDEYGNEWREIDVTNEKVVKETQNIQLQLKNEVPILPPDTQIESKLKTWLNSVGIDYNSTEKIYDTNGVEINAIAKTDILNKSIEVVEGKRDIITLPEESGHVLVELLGENHPLYKKMMKEITQYEVYNQVVNSEYAKLYNNDDIALRKEAIGKLIAQHIISQETGTETPEKIQKAKTWFDLAWGFIKSKLKNLIGSKYREDINAFGQSASIILNNSTEGLQSINEVEGKYNNIFYELDTSKQENALKLLKEIGVNYDVTTKKYYYKGNEVSKRVSDSIKEFYRKKFRNTALEETPKSKLLAMKGTIIHSYNRMILQNIIDGNEFTKGTIEKAVIEELRQDSEFKDKKDDFFRLKPKEFTELFNLSNKLFDRINAQQDEINKQTGRDDKAVILPELILYDKETDTAGTLDLFVLFSNGTASIYDYKGINFFTSGKEVLGNIADYKQDAYDLQILKHMNLSRTALGIDSFVETRILPINLQLNSNSEAGFYNVEAGSKGTNDEYREYLEELPVANELTGIKEIDEQLAKMFLLRDKEKVKLNNSPKDVVLRGRVTKINDSIRKLQVNRDTRYAWKEVQNIVNEYNKRKVLHEENKDSFTNEDLNDYEQYLKVYQGFFEKAIDIELDKDENKDKRNEVEASYFRINKNINMLLEDIGNKRMEILSREFNRDMSKTSKEPSFLANAFNKLSEFSRSQFKALSTLVKTGELETREFVNNVKSRIEEKEEVLKKWTKSKGITLQQAFDKIYDNKTGQLHRKYNNVYTEEKAEAFKKGNVQWFLDNTLIERNGDAFKYSDPETQKKFEETKEKQIQLINKIYPGDENTVKRERELLNWTAKHDITVTPEALFNQPYYIKPKENERFYTPTWKELNQIENKPLLDTYNLYIELNKEFSELTGKELSDYNVAEVQKDLVDLLSTNGVGGLGGLKDYLNNTFEVQQQDTVLGAGKIDPTTGEYIYSVPYLFTSNLTQKISDKEYQALKQEVLKKHPEGESVAFKDELKSEVLRVQREKGLQTKSNDLNRSFILMAEASYTHAYLNSTLETVKALRSTLEEAHTELTDNTGKSFINKYTQKVMSTMGVSSSELETFDKFFNLYYYGRRLQNKDNLISKEPTEISELLGEKRYYSTNKGIRGLLTYISAHSLGLSWVTGVGSAIGASQNLMIQASEGRFFNTKEIRKATKLLTQGDVKLNLLTKYFEAYAKDMTYEKANGLSASKLSKLFTMDNLYVFMKKPDEVIDRVVMGGILQHYGLNEGKVDKLSKLPEGTKSLYELSDVVNDKIVIDGLTKEQYIQVRSLMQKASSKIKGSIPQEDQNTIGLNIYMAGLMQFKNWIPTMLKDRGQTLSYDEESNDLEVGRFRVFFGEFTAKGLLPKLKAFTNTFAEVAAFGKYNRYSDGTISEVAQKYYDKFIEDNPELKGKVTIEDFIELRKAKLQGMAKELRQYLMFFVLVALAKAAVPDKDDEKPVERFIAMNAYRMTNRGLLELGFFLNPASFKQIMNKPLASMGLFDKVTKAIANGVQEGAEATGIIDENTRDKTPMGYYSIPLIPGNRAVLDIFDFFDKFKLQ